MSAGIALALAAGLAGCGSGHTTPALPAYDLQVADIHGLGAILVDGRGFAVYAYLPDRSGRPQCTGLCAQQWPPVDLPAGQSTFVAGPGVERSLLGTTRGATGGRQVTYDGWPLYLWQGDTRPRVVTGEADDMGLWWVISPDGRLDHGQAPR